MAPPSVTAPARAADEGELAVRPESATGLRLRFRLDVDEEVVAVMLESAVANSVGSGQFSSIAPASSLASFAVSSGLNCSTSETPPKKSVRSVSFSGRWNRSLRTPAVEWITSKEKVSN